MVTLAWLLMQQTKTRSVLTKEVHKILMNDDGNNIACLAMGLIQNSFRVLLCATMNPWQLLA